MGWILVAISALYVGAFGYFGWRIVRRKPLPSFGWALLGGLARWLSDFFLGFLFLILGALHQPGGLALGIIGLFRFGIWSLLAAMLYEPRRKQTLHFTRVMTLLNCGIDLLLFGTPTMSELLEPLHLGSRP